MPQPIANRRHGRSPRLMAGLLFCVPLLAPIFGHWAAAFAQQPNIDQLFRNAVDLQQQGDLLAAIRTYSEILKLRPEMVDARINLGAALAHTGDFDNAIAQYKLALPKAADKTSVRMNIGLAYYKKSDFSSAIREFEAVRPERPDDLQLAILLGDSEVKLGRGEAAVAMLLPMETNNASNTDFEYVLGTALLASKNRREGVVRLEKVAAATNDAGAYMLAGSTLLDLNEYESAHRDLEAALDLDPKLPRIYSLVGMAREKVTDKAGAEAAFRQALLSNPDDFDANLYLGAILAKRGEMDSARKYLDRAVQLNPSSSMARYELATWKSTAGQYDDAAKDLEAVLKSDPTWLEPHIELASVYYHLHRAADGAKERRIVDQIIAQQQNMGPANRPGPVPK